MKTISAICIALLILLSGGCNDSFVSGDDPAADSASDGTGGSDATISDQCANNCSSICPRTVQNNLPVPVIDPDCSYSRIGGYAQFWWTGVSTPSGYASSDTYIFYYSENVNGPYICIGTFIGSSWNYYFTAGEDDSRTYYYRLSAIFVDGSGNFVESSLSADCWIILPE